MKKLEFDGLVKKINMFNTNGNVELNIFKSDFEIYCDKLEGRIEVNAISSKSKLNLPIGTDYFVEKKGINNVVEYFIDDVKNKEKVFGEKNLIEVNGIDLKLKINEYKIK